MKWVLITGASSGIGYEYAKIFASEGYNLVLVARHKDKLLEVKKELSLKNNQEVLIIPLDLSKDTAAEKLITLLKKERIILHTLVNNAGFGDFGDVTETDSEKERQMITLNVQTLTQLSKYAAQTMKHAKEGYILNIASTAAFFPGPLMAVYYATKAYVLSFSLALGEELRGSGVFVTALCPGSTKKNFQKRAELEKSTLIRNRMLPSAKSVADYGYKALYKQKKIAIPGIMNKIQVSLSRLLSRPFQARIVQYIQRKR